MMLSRFYVESRIKSGAMQYEGAEFHHMVRVTRHQVGDAVRLFDGQGNEADAEITFVSRNSAALMVGKVEVIPEDEGPDLILAVAIPKATRASWLVEKAVELGVTKILPIRTQRSVVDPRQSKLSTLESNIIAACKQCGRSRLMELGSVIDWSDFIANELATSAVAIAHPGGVPFTTEMIASLCKDAPSKARDEESSRGSVTIVIGPEGGFTVEEITQAASRGAQLVSLGPRILRVETAALAAAALFVGAMMDA